MINHTHDHNGQFWEKWRAEAIKRFIAMSGPEYADVEMRVVAHQDEGTEVIWPDGEWDVLTRRALSYASWFLLRETPEGETVVLKVRSDDVGIKL